MIHRAAASTTPRDTIARVTLDFEPADPGESVLEPGAHGLPWFFLAMDLLFGTIGALMAKFLPRTFPPSAG